MKNITPIQKLSVLHCVYQMIASADGNIDEERDEAVISEALEALGLGSIHSWDAALQLYPYDCFVHVSELGAADRDLFCKLLTKLSSYSGNTSLRLVCAQHLINLTQNQNICNSL